MKTFISFFLANIGFMVFLGLLFIMAEYDAFTNEINLGLSARTVSILKVTTFLQIPFVLYFAVRGAMFTYNNFDEVWSRRMSWKNSNVDKLEARFIYSIKIFFKCLIAATGVIGIIVVIALFIIKLL